MRISVGEIRNQVATINNNLSLRNSLFLNMIRDVSNLVANEGLSGEAYKTVKSFFQAAYVGVAYGMISANDLIISANNRVIDALSYVGVERVDTEELSRILARIHAFTEEMNAIHTSIQRNWLGIEEVVTTRGPDRSAEIARERETMDLINRLVDADALASTFYVAADSKIQDVVAACSKIKTIMYNNAQKNFDFYLSDCDVFAKLYISGETVKLPSEILQNISEDDKRLLNDLIGLNFAAMVSIGAIVLPDQFKQKINELDDGSVKKYKVIYSERTGNLLESDDTLKKYYRNTFYNTSFTLPYQCTTYVYGRIMQLYGLDEVPANMRGIDDNKQPIPLNVREGGHAQYWIENQLENKSIGEPYYDTLTVDGGKLNVSDVRVGDALVWKQAGAYGHVAIVDEIVYDQNNNPIKVLYSEGNWRDEFSSSNPLGYAEREVTLDASGYLTDGNVGGINATNPGFYTRSNGNRDGIPLEFLGIIHTDTLNNN